MAWTACAAACAATAAECAASCAAFTAHATCARFLRLSGGMTASFRAKAAPFAPFGRGMDVANFGWIISLGGMLVLMVGVGRGLIASLLAEVGDGSPIFWGEPPVVEGARAPRGTSCYSSS